MKQTYSGESTGLKMKPTKETVQFLINFSKSLKVVKTKSNYLIELNLN